MSSLSLYPVHAYYYCPWTCIHHKALGLHCTIKTEYTENKLFVYKISMFTYVNSNLYFYTVYIYIVWACKFARTAADSCNTPLPCSSSRMVRQKQTFIEHSLVTVLTFSFVVICFFCWHIEETRPCFAGSHPSQRYKYSFAMPPLTSRPVC